MKQLLFPLLFLPCFAWAQYPANAGQKITLGEQTTADGLLYRGLASDTTRKPSVDTMAYILLDTTTNILWQYKKATSNAWLRLNLLPSDTSSMLTYYNRGSGTLNYLPKYTSTGRTLGNSLIFDNGTNVGIGTTSMANKLDVYGNIGVNTSGQTRIISTYYGANSVGANIFIGGGGLSSVGAVGETYKGAYNTSIGVNALYSNTTGYHNTAIGVEALYSNTTGYQNTANGYAALINNTTGYQNTATGTNALLNNTTGYNNTANGRDAGRYTNAGGNNQTSNNSVYLGYDTRASASGNTNEIVIGAEARGNGSNSITLGSSSITKNILYGNVGIGTTSPTARLHVQGSADASEFALRVNDSGNNNLLSVQNNGNVTLKNPLSVANGGTGQTTTTAALNALLPTQSQTTTIGATLKSNGTNSYWDNFSAAGTVQDQSGNFYNTVAIGTQVWFKENLRTKKYRNGNNIVVKTNTDTSSLVGQMYYYNNDSLTNYPVYGALYNWKATQDSLCPTGWHVPTDAEWTTLTTYLSSNVGGKLKATTTTYWNSPNTDATNETGFTALPGGFRNFDGSFYYIRNFAFFWSATEFDLNLAWLRSLYDYNGNVDRYSYLKQSGFSVRCLKN